MLVKMITKPKNLISKISPIKLRLIQQELILLFHAMKCKGCQCRNWSKYCVLPLCKTYKEVLDHISKCQVVKCLVPKCLSSKTILRHWMNCGGVDCMICNVVIKSSKVERFSFNSSTGQLPKPEKEDIKSEL